MVRQDSADAFASLRLFRGAGADFFRRLAQQPRARSPRKAGEWIYDAGDPADAVFAPFPADSTKTVPSGIVELSLPTAEAGNRTHLEHVVSGEVFGEFEFVASGLTGSRVVRRSSARAAIDVDLYRIPFDMLAAVAKETEAIRARLIKLSFDRLLSALDVKSTQLHGDRDVAFANWLVNASGNIGFAEGRHVRFSRPVGQSEIAQALGVTRETMSLRLNEWERAGLLNTGGQSRRLEILDYPRVVLRASIDKRSPQTAIDSAIAEIDGDLRRGELVRARNICLDLLTYFPASPDLRHRAALANIRAGNTREALAGLAYGGFATGGDVDLLADRVSRGLLHPATAPERLFFGDAGRESVEDVQDGLEESPQLKLRLPTLIEDIAAIEARAHKELAFDTPAPETRQTHAAASAAYYVAIHDRIGGAYAGINAATMAAVAGDRERSQEIARSIARQLGPKPRGYWAWATLGEALLLTGDSAGAAKAFAVARGQDDASDGHRSSTRRQLDRIHTHLALDVSEHIAALPVGATAPYSGPLFRGAELSDDAQADLEKPLREAVEQAFEAQSISYAYGALACGADIVVAEAALASGAELHVVLPFPVDMFVETSVAIGNPRDATGRWDTRFREALGHSSSLTMLVERLPETRELDAYYSHAFKLAAGMALLKSDALSSRAMMIAVEDGKSSESVAGTHAAASAWSAAGLPLVRISMPSVSVRKEPRAAAPNPFRAVVFAWPTMGSVDLSAMLREAAQSANLEVHPIGRSARDRRAGAAVLLESIDAALTLVATSAPLVTKEHPVRLILDFGPAADARGQPDETAIARLTGAVDLVGFPDSAPIATLNFAAIARAEPRQRVQFTPIGRASAGADRSRGGARPLPSREAFAVSFLR